MSTTVFMKGMCTLNQEVPFSNQDYISTERFSAIKRMISLLQRWLVEAICKKKKKKLAFN